MNKFQLDRAAQELWDIHGERAFKAAMERAEAAHRLGQEKLALEWREIAEACKGFEHAPPPKH